MDNDPQPRAILDPSFADESVAAMLDHVRTLLDATDLGPDTKADIMVAAIEYAGARALAAIDRMSEDWRRSNERAHERDIIACAAPATDWDDIKRAEADADRMLYGGMFAVQREDE